MGRRWQGERRLSGKELKQKKGRENKKQKKWWTKVSRILNIFLEGFEGKLTQVM